MLTFKETELIFLKSAIYFLPSVGKTEVLKSNLETAAVSNCMSDRVLKKRST